MGKQVKNMRKLKAMATPLTDIEKTAVLVQLHVHNCLNKLLKNNQLKQSNTFYKAAKACYDGNLIDFGIYEACININQAGNEVKHEAVMYLIMEFGCV